MKLISCRIENFGKLSDRTVLFDKPSGINVFCENNGWGKSTLAAFIKVMFFGFDNEGRRSNVENERQRFKPWQGGSYGGSITFETDGKTYTILRTFGTKEKDDEFLLQAADTGLASTDFSKNIGQELFQIDSASFARSVYISQNDCVTATTDSINAKLGNLTDNTDDLNNYETAAKRIADRLNAMSKTRKTGELYKQKEEITQLKQEIKKGEALDASMEGILKLKKDLHVSYETLKREQKQLQTRQKEISEYKDILVKRKEYEHLCIDEAKKQRLYEEKKAFFPERIPCDEEIDMYISFAYRTSVLKRNLDFNKLNDEESKTIISLEKVFSHGIPEDEAIEAAKAKISVMQMYRRNVEKNMLTEDEVSSLKRLGELFAGGEQTEAEIDCLSNIWTLRSEKKNILGSKKAAVDMLKMAEEAGGRNKDNLSVQKAKAYRKRSNLVMTALLAAVVLTALSAAAALIGRLLGALTLPVGIGILAVDIVAVIIWIAVILKRSKNEKYDEYNTGSDTVSDTEETAGGFDSPFEKLQKEIEDDEALIQKTQEDMKQFLLKYGISYNESSVTSDLYRLKEDLRLYERLLKKSADNDANGLKESYDRLRGEMEGFLQVYGLAMDRADENSSLGEADYIDIETYYLNLIYKLESDVSKYMTLKSKKESYEKSYEEYKKNMERLNSFIKEIKVESDMDLHSLLNLIKEMRAACVRIGSEYEKAVELKNEYETKNSEILDVIKNDKEVEEGESLTEIEERLSEISAQIEKYHTSTAAYERQLDELQEKRDEITEAENRLEELQELYGLNEKKLETLKKTQKYLESAKISLTAKYTKPIKEGFDKYFELLCGIESENYQLDANLDMSVMEQGMPRNTAFLSAGYQDMIGICMRMALIDAMYKDEKPFVIFDDPFVNLDEEKTKGALKLLDMIAKEYQVVYFTCNESRR